MGASAPSAFAGFKYSNLFTTPEEFFATPPRRLFGSSGLVSVPASGTNVFNVDMALSDPLNALADGYSIDYYAALFTVADTGGFLTLTDLLLELQSTPTGAIGFVIPGSYPTLLAPRNATAFSVVAPTLISGQDIEQFQALITAGGSIPLPANMRLRLIAAMHNSDGAAAHSVTVQTFARYRKLTGLREG